VKYVKSNNRFLLIKKLGGIFLLSVTYLVLIRIYSERGVEVVKNQMEKIYEKYYREVYLYAFSLCKNHHLAQDLTSDTFFKAYLSIDEVSYIKYWLFRVCKNLYIDHMRKNREISSDDMIEKMLTDGQTPLDKLISDEDKKYLYELILNLKESYREALILYYFCDFNIKKISQNMNISEGASKTLLYRARKKLKKEMEDKNEL